MKVMIVDDQEINRLLPKAILTRMGAEVREAGDGRRALAMLNDENVDAVLLDISMPGMSGTDVCRTLRADPRFAGLRIVAYTAHAFQSQCDEIMAAGFDQILVKPIQKDALLAALATA